MSLSEKEFEQLYRELGPRILAFLMRRVHAGDAPDLLAETFLVVWRRRDTVPGGDVRAAWVFGVAPRLVLAHHRDGMTRPTPVADPPEPAGPAACVAEAASADERSRCVQAALATLGDIDRELVLLTVWDGLTPAQVGAVVGLAPGSARVRLHRARTRMEAQLSALLPAHC